MKIIVDLDGVVCDFFKPLIEEYNNITNEGITVDTFQEWEMGDFVKDKATLYKIFQTPGFFYNLLPIAGSLEALKELKGLGHQLCVVTSPTGPTSANEKISWLKKYLPDLPYLIGKEKQWVTADMLIDDGPHNAEAYRKEHTNAHILGPTYPYNNVSCYNLRTNASYKDPIAVWGEILAYIKGIKNDSIS